MRPSELFAQDNRAAVRAEHPGHLDRAVRNRLSEMWRSADAATREAYVDRAKTLLMTRGAEYGGTANGCSRGR